MTLMASLAFAGSASWWFLSPASEKGESQVHWEGEPPAVVSIEQEVREELEPEERGGRMEADVTFSFAREVAVLANGSIIEQDDLFRVTCRNASGTALWEIGMDDALMAALEVDANDDGTREFLLVDSRQGIGLDPEGRPIPGFAIRPTAPITSFAMVDYDGDGQERYLFGLADGRVLNHRKLGERTPGWRHDSKGTPIQAIAHLRTGRKDYICTVDVGGVVMLLKRNGQRRVRTPVQLDRQTGQRAVAFDIRSDIETSAIISRNAEGEIESRAFGEGVARNASASEQQLLQTVEGRMASEDGLADPG